MKILIKNMVSTRCIMVVKSVLKDLEIPYDSLELGEVETPEDLTQQKLKALDMTLREFGLEVKEDKKSQIVEKIKSAIIELVQDTDEQMKVTLSDYLTSKLNYSCAYLSSIFSETQGTSIEKFFIKNKIEHVKQLLVNDGLNLKEISYRTRYSSVAHLSYQFKKTTGFAPSQFRQMQGETNISAGQLIY